MRGYVFNSNGKWFFYLENSGISMPVVGGHQTLVEGKDDYQQVFCDVNRTMTGASIVSIL